MKRYFQVGLMAAAILAGASVSVQAQGPAPQIALIDLAHVFNHHPRYEVMKNDLKTAFDLAELDIKQRRDKCREMHERLGGMQRSSAEFQTLEAALTKEQANLNVQMQLERKRLADQEAKMLMTVYQDVQDEVAAFCQQNGVRVVLRHVGSEPIESSEQVISLLNRQVMYADPAIDITQVIVQQLQRKHGATGAAVSTPATARQPAPTPNFRPR